MTDTAKAEVAGCDRPTEALARSPAASLASFRDPEELVNGTPNPQTRKKPTANRLKAIAKLVESELAKPPVVPEVDGPKYYQVT